MFVKFPHFSMASVSLEGPGFESSKRNSRPFFLELSSSDFAAETPNFSADATKEFFVHQWNACCRQSRSSQQQRRRRRRRRQKNRTNKKDHHTVTKFFEKKYLSIHSIKNKTVSFFSSSLSGKNSSSGLIWTAWTRSTISWRSIRPVWGWKTWCRTGCRRPCWPPSSMSWGSLSCWSWAKVCRRAWPQPRPPPRCSLETNRASKLNLTRLFLPLSPIHRSYLCFTSQMALLGFYHNSSLFTSTVTSIQTRAWDNRHCVRERVHVAGVPERIGALKTFGCIWVQTPVVWVARECIMHCDMPHGSLKQG